jgi:hypothetical protein
MCGSHSVDLCCSVTASAYVEMIAKIRGKCDLCPEDEPAASPAPTGGDPRTWGPAEPSPKPADKPADSPAPLHEDPQPPAQASPKPADSTNLPKSDITGTIASNKGAPSLASPSPSPQLAILVGPPSSLPNSPSPAKGDGKGNGKDKKVSPAPASPAPIKTAPTGPISPVLSKYKQCNKSMQNNGCCGGKGFDAKASVCQCMDFNGRWVQLCRACSVSHPCNGGDQYQHV